MFGIPPPHYNYYNVPSRSPCCYADVDEDEDDYCCNDQDYLRQLLLRKQLAQRQQQQQQRLYQQQLLQERQEQLQRERYLQALRRKQQLQQQQQQQQQHQKRAKSATAVPVRPAAPEQAKSRKIHISDGTSSSSSVPIAVASNHQTPVDTTKLNDAASLIQEWYRSQSQAKKRISSLYNLFKTLQERDGVDGTTWESANAERLTNTLEVVAMNDSFSIPPTRVNRELFEAEERLTRVLLAVDAIESGGNDRVRDLRRKLVKEVQARLAVLEDVRAQAIQRFTAASSSSSAEYVSEDPMESIEDTATLTTTNNNNENNDIDIQGQESFPKEGPTAAVDPSQAFPAANDSSSNTPSIPAESTESPANLEELRLPPNPTVVDEDAMTVDIAAPLEETSATSEPAEVAMEDLILEAADSLEGDLDERNKEEGGAEKILVDVPVVEESTEVDEIELEKDETEEPDWDFVESI